MTLQWLLIARNTKEAITVINELQDNSIKINILNLGIIDNSSIRKFTTTVLLSVSEMDTDMIVNRTQEGKYAKKYNLNYRGGLRTRLTRKNKDKYTSIYEYKQSCTVQETEKSVNILVSTFFKE